MTINFDIDYQKEATPKCQLSWLILQKTFDILSVTNSELIKLFWKSGKELSKHFDFSPKTKQTKELISKTSDKLVSEFGLFFREKNLNNMILFSDQFSEEDISKFTPFLSWGHILVLLKVEDWEQKLFYGQNAVNNDLEEKQLRNIIKTQALPIGGTKKSKSRRKHIESIQPNTDPHFQLLLNKHTLENLFIEPTTSSLRPLLEPRYNKKVLSGINEPGNYADVFSRLSHFIQGFRMDQNNWLNAHLNLTFWEMGKIIFEEVGNGIGSNSQIILKDLCKFIDSETGIQIKMKQLQTMVEFYKRFPEIEQAGKLAYLLTWDQLIVILLLDNREEQFFYTRMVATECLSTTQLKKRIKEEIYSHSKSKTNFKQKHFRDLGKSVSSYIKNRKGNKIVKGENIHLQINVENELRKNIYKNKYFKMFMG